MSVTISCDKYGKTPVGRAVSLTSLHPRVANPCDAGDGNLCSGRRVRVVSGLLPVYASCKKIQDSPGGWHPIFQRPITFHRAAETRTHEPRWRRGPESNRRIKVLQTSPLPLGYRALCVHVRTWAPSLSTLCERIRCTRGMAPPQVFILIDRENGRQSRRGALGGDSDGRASREIALLVAM